MQVINSQKKKYKFNKTLGTKIYLNSSVHKEIEMKATRKCIYSYGIVLGRMIYSSGGG